MPVSLAGENGTPFRILLSGELAGQDFVRGRTIPRRVGEINLDADAFSKVIVFL